MGLLSWPGFAVDPVALGRGDGFWFVLEAGTGLGSRELCGVRFGWAGGGAASAVGLAQVDVPLRLPNDPDFTRNEPTPLS